MERLQLSEQIVSLSNKVDDLENSTRRNNLLVFGMNEPENETNSSLKDVIVKHIFEEKLGVKVKSVERIHRLGRKRNAKDRPVILRFLDFNDKINFLRHDGKLRGTAISFVRRLLEEGAADRTEAMGHREREPTAR